MIFTWTTLSVQIDTLLTHAVEHDGWLPLDVDVLEGVQERDDVRCAVVDEVRVVRRCDHL